MQEYLKIALAKGRIAEKVLELFLEAGLIGAMPDLESRKLVLVDEDAKMEFIMVKPSDVGKYVENGAADIGVLGSDTLQEQQPDVYEILDLRLGRCRICTAGLPEDRERYEKDKIKKVATKYPETAKEFFRKKAMSVQIISLNGSVELAPIADLADIIVDIVETGSTLKENGLEVFEEIGTVSSRLTANKVSFRFKSARINQVAGALRSVLDKKEDGK